MLHLNNMIDPIETRQYTLSLILTLFDLFWLVGRQAVSICNDARPDQTGYSNPNTPNTQQLQVQSQEQAYYQTQLQAYQVYTPLETLHHTKQTSDTSIPIQ